MKITVLGATGGVGGEVVKQALDRGWHVTAVVRDPARLKLPAHVVVAGLHEQEKLTAAVEGPDAVISALGSRDGNVRGSYTIRRADVAGYLLDAVAEPTLIRTKVSIAHG